MITLQIANNFDDEVKLSNKLITEIIYSILINSSEYQKANISIIIENDEYLRNLKIKYFNMDILTDVITFNLSDNNIELDAEIYISWDRIIDNAKKYKQTVEQESKRIIIHGCLHLVGFNDSTKEEINLMRKKEQEYLNKFNQNIIL
ncbi:MAG: rRNA maturation RNase YbeY [Candidatus Marinimicrobia bacterium]|nr:rRNA maturation RNase YbeY [Candidatus Neomarinimicrobiota bacterium]|tara:strand:- start:1163 stop:1603 length:441 start_codon:yes stop_codon:yes gene_type:complete